MKKISRKSRNIIKLIESGMTRYAITQKGYKRETVRYHWRKIKNPEKHRQFVAKIQALNKKRLYPQDKAISLD
jgi:hypothetical protein